MRSLEKSSTENDISGGNRVQCPHLSSITVQNIKCQIVWVTDSDWKGFELLTDL